MRAYLDLLRRVLKEGSPRADRHRMNSVERPVKGLLFEESRQQFPPMTDRTGTGTRSLFGESLSFDMTQGFPLMTTKKIYTRSMIYELLWFLRGEDHIGFLKKHKVGIWDAWADEHGYLGPTYGVQWRAFPAPDGTYIDQIARAVEMLRHQPDSRRIVVSAWNPTQIDQTVLPPCHCFFQFYVDNKRRLSCALYQRSADIFLGVPFNIASYALLTSMMAHITNLKPHKIKLFFGDVHLYNNHIEQACKQLTRNPYPLPRLVLDKNIKEIDAFTFDSIAIHDYQHHDALSASISV